MIIRRNLATNPGIEGVLNWSSNNGSYWAHTVDTAQFHSGAKSILSTPQAAAYATVSPILSAYNVGGGLFPVIVGKVYTVSLWFMYASVDTIQGSKVGYIFLDAAGANIGGGTYAPYVNPGPNIWARSSVVTVPAPANAVNIRILATIDKFGTTVKAGDLGWIDDCVVEEGNVLGNYFDGSTITSDKTEKYSWEGAVNASTSVLSSSPNAIRRNCVYNPGAGGTTGWGHFAGTTGVVTTSNPSTGGPLPNVPYYQRATYTTAQTVANGYWQTGSSTLATTEIKVIPGEDVTASFYVRSSQALQIRAQVNYYTYAGVYISSLAGTNSTLVVGTWTRLSVSGKVPATAARAVILTQQASAGPLLGISDYIDASAMLYEKVAALDTYFDGNAVWDTRYKYAWTGTVNTSDSIQEAIPVGARRNRAQNPRAAIDTNGWVAAPGTTGVRTIANVTTGGPLPECPSFVRMTWTTAPTVANQYLGYGTVGSQGQWTMNCVPGENITASLYVRTSVDGLQVRAQLAFYDSAGTYLGVSVYPPLPQALVANTWTRISVSGVALPGSNRCFIYIQGASAGPLPVIGSTMDVTGVLVGDSGPYFDGAMLWDTAKYSWAGNAHLSESNAEPANILRKNRINNPIGPVLTTSNAHWTPARGTNAVNVDAIRLTINDATIGAFSQRIVSPSLASAAVLRCTPGQVLALSAQLRTNVACLLGCIQFNFFDVNDTSTGAPISSPEVALNANTFTQINLTATAYPNSVKMILYLGIGTGARNLSEWIDFKNIMVEAAGSAGPFFDGNSISDSSTEYAWSGTVVSSESVAIGRTSQAGKNSDMFQQLVNAGYGPGTLVDMEYKRLLSKNGLSYPQKLSLYDLYSLAGEKPRIAAFRR